MGNLLAVGVKGEERGGIFAGSFFFFHRWIELRRVVVAVSKFVRESASQSVSRSIDQSVRKGRKREEEEEDLESIPYSPLMRYWFFFADYTVLYCTVLYSHFTHGHSSNSTSSPLSMASAPFLLQQIYPKNHSSNPNLYLIHIYPILTLHNHYYRTYSTQKDRSGAIPARSRSEVVYGSYS